VLRIGDYVKKHGEKVIIITEQKFYDTQYIQKLEKILKTFAMDFIIYDEITPDSGSEDINNISILTRTSRADLVIGLGGQRTLNIAKAVSLFAYNEKSFYYYIKNPDKLIDKVPVILIPTTPRDYFALTDTIYYKDQDLGHIRLFHDDRLYADYVFIDPTFTVDISPKILSSMLIEMIGYSVDAIVSKNSTIFTDTLLYKSIETINKNFHQYLEYPEEMEFRKDISLSGLFLMMSGKISGFSLIHGLTLAVTSVLKIPKIISSTILIPHIIEFYIPTAPEKLSKISQCLDKEIKDLSPVEASLLTVEHIQKLIHELELPNRLSYYNVQKEILGKIVDEAYQYNLLFNSVRVVTREDLFNILYTSL